MPSVPGLVIRYSYLWRRQADQGREGGGRDRPCAIVAAVKNDPGGKTVYVLPIVTSRNNLGTMSRAI